MAKNTKTPAMVLQELSVKKSYAPPTYEIVYSITGTHENRFDYRVSVAGVVAEGTGSSKQISKHNAAHNALMKLKDLGIYHPPDNPVQEFKVPLQNKNIAPDSPFKASPNCIGPLKDLCLEYKIQDPIFTLISDVGPPHSREFTFECSVASIKTSATGSTKKMAKQFAAQEMLERIKDVLPEIAAQYTSVSNNNKAIFDSTDNMALKTYNEFFAAIVPDKAVKVEDYSCKLKKIMDDLDLKFKDFSLEFSQKKDEMSLKQITDKLGLAYKLCHLQDNPTMVSLSLNTDTPFTVIGISDSSLEKAKCDAFNNAFEIMRTFMQI